MNEIDGIDFFSLRLFTVIAETRSFTRAAEALGLTQSAVSRHLQRLEDQVGVRLFERTTRKVRLTDAGTFFLTKSKTLRDSWKNSICELRETFVDGPKRVRLALSETVGFSYLPGFVSRYKRERPDDLLEISQLPSQELIAEILAQNRELGVVTDREGDFPSEIEVIHRFEDRFVGIAPSDSGISEIPDLLARPLIALAGDGSSILSGKIQKYLNSQASDVSIAMEAQGFDFIINLVSTGFGCAIVPIRSLALYGKRKPVQRIPLVEPFSRDLAIIARRDHRRPDHLARFLELVLF